MNDERANTRERTKRASRQSEKVVITCPGCAFTIRVRPATARRAKDWDGLYCGRNACSWSPPRAEGLMTSVSFNAVGSFRGWKHIFPDDEQLASVKRARMIAAAALAVQPGSAAQSVMRALVEPAGGNGRHLVTLANGWSTGVTIESDGTIEVENPMVAAELHRVVIDGQEGSVTVRTFTEEISHAAPDGFEIPFKEMRGWYINDGAFYPFTEALMFEAHCTDAETGDLLPPEQGVRYMDAYPVATGLEG